MDQSKAYISKEEKKIPINDPTGKWSDLTLLPEWSEKYYDVYTVRKHGKWVMLKALKPEYADKQEYREMIEQEFETRYNLAHPNIDEKRLTPKIVHRLQTQLLDAMQYIQENHIVHDPITPDTIIFTEYNENLKLINVGYAQRDKLSTHDTQADIRSYGAVLNEVLDYLPTSLPRLRKIAEKCETNDKSLTTVADIHLAVERRNSSQIYYLIIAFITVMVMLLLWMTLR